MNASIADKLNVACDLAWELEESGSMDDTVWYYTEGWAHKRIQTHLGGKCSL